MGRSLSRLKASFAVGAGVFCDVECLRLVQEGFSFSEIQHVVRPSALLK